MNSGIGDLLREGIDRATAGERVPPAWPPGPASATIGGPSPSARQRSPGPRRWPPPRYSPQQPAAARRHRAAVACTR